MKKLIAVLLAAVLAAGMVACGSTATAGSAAPSGSTAAADTKTSYKIGIIQLVQHDALDQACKGFQDALTEAAKAKGVTVEFDVQNASGEQSTCATIATKFVNDKVDLILAIATPAAQAAAQASSTIPVLVTAVTDPESAGLVASNAAPGGNVSGTSDMNPVEKQAALLQTLVPNAKKVGIMYCSAEDNSVLQAELAKAAFEKLGMEVEIATAADSNEIQAVTTKLCGTVDAIYIPTDNTFASAMPTVTAVTNPAKMPVICGEESMMLAGGLATYSINYYNLGKMTADMAAEILFDGADIAAMPIQYSEEADLSVIINEETAAAIGVEIPADLKK